MNKEDDRVFKKLEKKKNYGSDCTCGNPKPYKYIHEGEWDEIMEICLNCGGDIWNRA